MATSTWNRNWLISERVGASTTSQERVVREPLNESKVMSPFVRRPQGVPLSGRECVGVIAMYVAVALVIVNVLVG